MLMKTLYKFFSTEAVPEGWQMLITVSDNSRKRKTGPMLPSARGKTLIRAGYFLRAEAIISPGVCPDHNPF